MHYITKGMGPACSPARLSIHMPTTLDPYCSPAAHHPSPSSFLWPQLSFHPLLQFILSPPPLSPAHAPLPFSNCYRSDLAGSSLSLHPGCFLLCFCSGKCSKRDWKRSVRASFSTTSHVVFFYEVTSAIITLNHSSTSQSHLTVSSDSCKLFFIFKFQLGSVKP